MIAVAIADDSCTNISIDSDSNTRMQMWKIHDNVELVLVLNKAVESVRYKNTIYISIELINRGNLPSIYTIYILC
jgi:hypothetical protein